MKLIRYIPLISILFLIEFSCKKDSLPPSGTSSLIIVHAVVGSSSLVTNFSGTNDSKITDTLHYYNNALQIDYGSFKEISSYSGTTILSLSQITDTTHSVWTGSLDLPVNTIHSLFITGTVTQPDTMFTTDNPPYHNRNSDSTIGVRFVNLSTGSNAVSVIVKLNIAGTIAGDSVSSLPYKNITDFKRYLALAGDSTYRFEFHDVTSGSLLASYTMTKVNNGTGVPPALTTVNALRFRNFTIALIGTPGSTNAILIKNNF